MTELVLLAQVEPEPDLLEQVLELATLSAPSIHLWLFPLPGECERIVVETWLLSHRPGTPAAEQWAAMWWRKKAVN